MTKTTKTPLNIVAMLGTLGIHEASSKPKPAAPRRSASPTLSKREFKVASPAPKKTPRIPTYGLVVIDCFVGCAEGETGAVLDSTAVTWEALTLNPGRCGVHNIGAISAALCWAPRARNGGFRLAFQFRQAGFMCKVIELVVLKSVS